MRRLLLAVALLLIAPVSWGATVGVLCNTWNTTAGNKNCAGTPAVDDLIVVVCSVSGVTNACTAVSDNNSGGAGSYTQIGSANYTMGTANSLTMWVRTAAVGSASSTTFSMTAPGSTNGSGLAVYAIVGSSNYGTSAIAQQSGTTDGGSGTTPAPVFGATPSSSNPILAVVVNQSNPANMTVRTGYNAEHYDVGYNTPPRGLHVTSINSGETSATITWGSTSGSTFSAMIVEIDPGGGGGPTCAHTLPLMGAGCS